MPFSKISKLFLTSLRNLGLKLAEEFLPEVWEFINAKFSGKTVAVIGPTASGKDSLIARLRGREIPEVHINTGAPEKVQKYSISYITPSGEDIKIYVKEGLNVGGEEPDRDDYWEDACKESDFIFYLLDAHRYKIQTREYTSRIKNDLRWLSSQLAKNTKAKVVVIVNKIDLLIQDGASLNEAESDSDIRDVLDKVSQLTSEMLGSQAGRLKGVNPLSTKDSYYYSQLFPSILLAAIDK